MRATFSGNRPFPLEMLTEDECFPFDMRDVLQIIKSIRREGTTETKYEVTVRKYAANRIWNTDKWLKFGWRLDKLVLN